MGHSPAGSEKLYWECFLLLLFFKRKKYFNYYCPELTYIALFWFLSPSHWGGWQGGGSESLVLSCWLGINYSRLPIAHKTPSSGEPGWAMHQGKLRELSELWEAGWTGWQLWASAACYRHQTCTESSLSCFWVTQQAESPDSSQHPWAGLLRDRSQSGCCWMLCCLPPAQLGLDPPDAPVPAGQPGRSARVFQKGWLHLQSTRQRSGMNSVM